jgi:hypothetical protein
VWGEGRGPGATVREGGRLLLRRARAWVMGSARWWCTAAHVGYAALLPALVPRTTAHTHRLIRCIYSEACWPISARAPASAAPSTYLSSLDRRRGLHACMQRHSVSLVCTRPVAAARGPAQPNHLAPVDVPGSWKSCSTRGRRISAVTLYYVPVVHCCLCAPVVGRARARYVVRPVP